MPNHPIALQLLDYLSYPLAAPSANIFGRVSPTEASAVVKELGGRILYVLDGGSCEVGLESTVIRIDEVGKVIILRPGAVTKEMLEQTIGSGNVGYEDPNKPQNPTAPGMTDNHYAPRTPLFVLPFRMEDLADPEKKEAVVKLILKAMAMLQIKESFKVGLLCMKGDPEWNASFFKQLLLPLFKDGAIPQYRLEIGTLSVKGDLNESARNLFSEFRRMDEIGLKVVFSEPLFDKRGIGFAIADRLNKASIKMT
jgi:L-threonylcarbamoyladenylate synthase